MRKPGQYSLAPRRGSGLRCIIFPVIGALIAMGITRTFRHSSNYNVPATPAMTLSVTATRDFESPADIDASDTLLADIYPSKQSAMRALALRLPEVVGQIIESPNTFRMSFDDRPESGSLLYEAVRKHFPGAKIAGPALENEKLPGQVSISLRIDDDPVKSPRRTAKGNIQVNISTADRATSLSAKFSQCDWADDLAQYVNEHSGHTWVVARSPNPCPNHNEARQAAEEAATGAILQMLRPRTPVNNAPLGLTEQNLLQIRGDIRNQLPISDRFVQQFRRPYGNIWSEAILLDVSPQWLNRLGQQQVEAQRHREARVQNTAVSMVIVCGAILLAYAFANTVTRRYFTGQLRAAAIVCALAALAITIAIISFA